MSSLASAAVPAGADARLLVRQIAQARDSFLTSGVAPRLLRPVVAQSWRRSLSLGLDPQAVQPPVELDGEQLRGYRSAHPSPQPCRLSAGCWSTRPPRPGCWSR